MPHDAWKANNICLYVDPAVRASLGSKVSDFDEGIKKWNSLYSQKKAAIRINQSTTDGINCIQVKVVKDVAAACGYYNGEVPEACGSYPHVTWGYGTEETCSNRWPKCAVTDGLWKQKLIIGLDAWNNPNYSSINRQSLVMHELGHNLGMMHPYADGGSLIPGTPTVDYRSIMAEFLEGFSEGDIKAAAYMYPYNNVLVCLEWVQKNAA